MTRKEQNKILDDKTESNINQYKVDRLNAEISAFSSGDLNKCEFLTRKDLKYKPNALDKARFEFSPLGKTFSTGLDKTAQGYQEEGVIKLLKDIRDGLRDGVNKLDDDRPDRPDDRPDRPDDRLDRPDDRPYRPGDRLVRPDDKNDNNNDDNSDKISEYQEVINSLLEKINNSDNNDKISEYQEFINSLLEKINNNDDNDDNDDNVALNSVFLNNLNNEISNVKSDGEHYERLIAYQNETTEKLKKELADRKNLTNDIIDETSKTINENKKECLEYHNKYKNTLFGYINAFKQLNDAENTYGREIGDLNNTINGERIRTNELIKKAQYLENAEEKSSETIYNLNNELYKLKNKEKFLENDNKKLKESIDLIERNNNYLIKKNSNIQDKVKKDEVKIGNMLNKFNVNMKNNMSNLYKKVKYEKNKLDAKLDKLDNDAKKLNNYIKENNDKIINTENKLDNANNKYSNLLLECNQLNEEFTKIKDDLYKTKNELNKSEDDINEKNKKK